ncbi:MAG: transglycosylase domain-containing protein [Clostridia bacterium]|nr:transglycosylase domain-containing protein [Clostridia bacterium]
MKKFIKYFIVISLSCIAFCSIFIFSYFFSTYIRYSHISLNTDSLTDSSLNIKIYDNENKIIEEQNNFNNRYVKINEIPNHTKQAFISIEDKNFYKHNGINKKRILKALYNNIKSLNIKEGASTISQQLIKNTHLSSEKTFKRKIKEVILTKKLEKNYTKNEILEYYLNIIYFGNNCYGIENASIYYFSKPCKELNIEESCMLAGLIKSPNSYSPITSLDTCKKRRDIVITEMFNDGYITKSQEIKAKNSPINLNLKTFSDNKLNSYSEACIDEAIKILKLPAKQIALGGYKIHTYQNAEKQQNLISALKITNMENNDNAGIVIDSKSHGIIAYYGESSYKILDAKRQPGSVIKPILVYTPALNEDIITPETQILDEEISIEGYKPKNYNNSFSGYLSIKDSIKKSVNIPAIKVMNYVGIENCKEYGKKLGIKFDEKDIGYPLALGGMTYGCNIKDLASAYTVFNNKGFYSDAKFISYITDNNNKLVYLHKPKEERVFREDSVYLMTDILKETAKNGTARKLSDLNIEVASKTGTVEKINSKNNLDAWNISYTPSEVIGVWCGNLDNSEIEITGSGKPTIAVKNYLKKYDNNTDTFEKPSSVYEVDIDYLELEKNHKVVLANPSSPERYKKKVLLSRFNTPNEISSNFKEKPEINVNVSSENKMIKIKLNTEKHIDYKIYKNSYNDKNLIKNIYDSQGETDLEFLLTSNEDKIIIVSSYNNMKDSPQNFKEFILTNLDTKKINKNTKNSKKWYIN